jgi:hypothetical protein
MSPSRASKSVCFVGQVGNLPPIENRRRARPKKLLSSHDQSSLHRIRLNISNNPPKLGFVANQSIIALVLPELMSREAQDSIAFPSRRSLKRMHNPRNFQQRCHQEMHMIRHHDKRVQLEVSLISILKCFHNNFGNFGPFEIVRPSARAVQKPINRHEGLPRSCCRGEASISRQTSVQSPSEENVLANGIIVRQPPSMERSHKEKVRARKKLLTFVGQVGNLPPLEKRLAAELANSSKADFQSAAGYQPALQSLQ